MEKEIATANHHPVALVVDDEPLILMDTTDIISDAGYHVVEARNADEALAYLRSHSSLRLMVTDIQMPGTMDGIDLSWQAAEHRPDVCLVVASGAVKPQGSQRDS